MSDSSIRAQDTSIQVPDDAMSARAPSDSEPMALKGIEKRLRLWPGVLIIALLWSAVVLSGWIWPGTMVQFQTMFMGPMVAAVGVLIWWLFFSRLRWADRFLAIVVCVGAGAAMVFLGDPSVGVFGLILHTLPAAITAWVLWLLVSYPLGWPIRRVGLMVVLLATFGYFMLLRMDGVWGEFSTTMSWRWMPTAEDKLMAEENAVPAAVPVKDQSEKIELKPGDWAEFRGANRDGRLTGVTIRTDWNEHPPRKVWHQRIGPGWSSFAVIGNRLYTQEQRGTDEMVVCYRADTGAKIWQHVDAIRFEEAVAGAGPRSTPTFHEGKIYALGAKGQLNCLDALTGKMVWSHDIVADSGAKVPQWGFASSPLVVEGIVIVFAGAPEGKSVLGYHADSGKLAWTAGEGEFSYCSPQRVTIGGTEQVVLATGLGLAAFDPKQGKVLWKYDWPMDSNGARVIQPALVGDSDLLLGTGFGNGTRRLHIDGNGNQWNAKEVWQTSAISPYFNDMVIHKRNLYGFNTAFFTCVNLDKGKLKWKARGYDCGQVLLLADQDLLLILSEHGDAALVEATPDGHKELGRFKALEGEGRCWNHPVVAHGKLFVRNGEFMACYDLTGSAEKRVSAR